MAGNGPVLNLLFIGDVVGKGGRNAVRLLTPELKQRFHCSFAIVNGENSANGAGFSLSCIKDMEIADVLTAGDHVWDQKNFETEILSVKNLVRPANLSTLQPGKGWNVFRNPAGGEVAVISLMGKVFMKESAYCPFETVEKILPQIPRTVKCIIVDLHAEATSEKAAMAWFLDGRVTAVIGTHTHVQTADERILPQGTGFLTDVGMTGAQESVIGVKYQQSVSYFRGELGPRFESSDLDCALLGAIFDIDEKTGRCQKVQRVNIR